MGHQLNELNELGKTIVNSDIFFWFFYSFKYKHLPQIIGPWFSLRPMISSSYSLISQSQPLLPPSDPGIGEGFVPVLWLKFTALHWFALHCTALQCSTLLCTALICAALHFTALHYTAPVFWHSPAPWTRHIHTGNHARPAGGSLSDLTAVQCSATKCSVVKWSWIWFSYNTLCSAVWSRAIPWLLHYVREEGGLFMDSYVRP